jgi:hypothetical protein
LAPPRESTSTCSLPLGSRSDAFVTNLSSRGRSNQGFCCRG